jgi:predicted component of type VI protein secretion system
MRTALQVSVTFKGRPVSSRIYDGDHILIGRDADCDLRLKNIGVSRHHARIDRQGEGFLLRDMRSAQGLQIDKKRVESWTIHDGDEIQLTKFSLLFRVVEIADPEDPPGASDTSTGDLETIRPHSARETFAKFPISEPGVPPAAAGRGWTWLLLAVATGLAGAILYLVFGGSVAGA